jgi:CubicO group peptidase (beta-lactamase class C family)
MKWFSLSFAVVALVAGAEEGAAAPHAPSGRAQLQQLVDQLAVADQAAYERFVRANYSPAALADSSPEDLTSALGRVHMDSGGFTIERVVRETPALVQAEARDRIVGTRYCLTLKRDKALIAEFGSKGIYPAGPQLAAPSAEEVAQAMRALAEGFAARGDFSGVVLVAKDDQVVFEHAYGQASPAYAAPMTLDTRLNIASIGKRFTGVAIGQLVDAGNLSYDDTVGKWLPEYPDQAVRDKVTLRQLLSHTSGLGPNDYYEGPLWAGARPRLRSVADYMRLVVGTKIGSEPGQYLYSNSGYVLLGAIIEKASGQDYYDYVRQHIFGPAGMTHSFYHELDHEDPKVAVPLTNLYGKGEDAYIFRLGAPRNATYELAAKGGPQGGAFVTAADLFAFERALRDGKLVSAERLREMDTAQSPSGAGASGLVGDVREGLGVEVIRQNGHTFYGHTGGDLGVASMVYWYPDSGLTTILLSNRDPRAGRVMANVSRALITRQTLNGAVPPAQACVAP